MSGGHFEYIQFRIREVIEDLTLRIQENPDGYSKVTLGEFKSTLGFVMLAQTYLHRVDWLISGDDGEENFKRKLVEDLANTLADLKLLGIR